jgi:predicted outer membrane lipoprotein
VSFFGWMLGLHLLAAFAIAAALVLFSVIVYRGRRLTTLDETRLLFRVAPVGTILITAGIGLVFALGVILALDSNRFELWDGWVVAGIVLWALFAGAGQRTGAYYQAIQKLAEEPGGANESEVLARLRAPTGALLHLATFGLFALVLLDMIFKPGA